MPEVRDTVEEGRGSVVCIKHKQRWDSAISALGALLWQVFRIEKKSFFLFSPWKKYPTSKKGLFSPCELNTGVCYIRNYQRTMWTIGSRIFYYVTLKTKFRQHMQLSKV